MGNEVSPPAGGRDVLGAAKAGADGKGPGNEELAALWFLRDQNGCWGG